MVLTAAAILPLISNPSRALPLFGRKYGMECTSCHLAAPRLNSFGMHFKQNGYRLPGTQGSSPWDTTERVFPIALVGNVAYHVTSTNTDLGNGSHERTNVSTFEQQQVESTRPAPWRSKSRFTSTTTLRDREVRCRAAWRSRSWTTW
jgi:hypothetical protein